MPCRNEPLVTRKSARYNRCVTKVTLAQQAMSSRMRREPNVSDERQAYVPGDAIYTKTGKRRAMKRQASTRTEARLGSLIACGGIIWTAYTATVDYSGLWQFRVLNPGPIEVCAVGILIWLHAKWRRSLEPK
jgi:hypothetical protein